MSPFTDLLVAANAVATQQLKLSRLIFLQFCIHNSPTALVPQRSLAYTPYSEWLMTERSAFYSWKRQILSRSSSSPHRPTEFPIKRGVGNSSQDITLWRRGKYELRPAIKKLYQLRPKMSASRVSVASRVVSPKNDESRPAVSKELHQLHRKIWVYKMSNNWKVLHSFIVLYLIHNYTHTNRIVEWYRQRNCISCYGLMFKLY